MVKFREGFLLKDSGGVPCGPAGCGSGGGVDENLWFTVRAPGAFPRGDDLRWVRAWCLLDVSIDKGVPCKPAGSRGDFRDDGIGDLLFHRVGTGGFWGLFDGCFLRGSGHIGGSQYLILFHGCRYRAMDDGGSGQRSCGSTP